MSAVKKYSCPSCGTHVSNSYAFTIADGKRYICLKCGAHLVPKTENVIYRRVVTIVVAFAAALMYHFAVFKWMGVEQNITNQVVMLFLVVAAYVLSVYLLIIRSVEMKQLGD